MITCYLQPTQTPLSQHVFLRPCFSQALIKRTVLFSFFFLSILLLHIVTCQGFINVGMEVTNRSAVIYLANVPHQFIYTLAIIIFQTESFLTTVFCWPFFKQSYILTYFYVNVNYFLLICIKPFR